MSAREFWKTVHRLTASGIDGYVRDQEAEHLQRPKIVVLCGSTRYWQELAEANLYETAAGRIVLAPGCNLKQPHPLWAAPAQADRLKQVLDALHRQKIDLADEVLIVNPDGYIGDSTRNEIDYAHSLGKPICYTHPTDEDGHDTAPAPAR
ncbi:hypothetical protein OOK36_55675 [Streptomyces sp. NBC_00365]|uniref:hypothetical protein n=1 Tax=Streptomyces sp. NBC_00365 TaxID=2975726 RepID=UPI00225A2475|nr:hypothetical protein [Streptomyces sp. NBC_00365]MCX5097697.1 hypothetical protein [Streptomyces sp. NBC_00365]